MCGCSSSFVGRHRCCSCFFVCLSWTRTESRSPCATASSRACWSWTVPRARLRLRNHPGAREDPRWASGTWTCAHPQLDLGQRRAVDSRFGRRHDGSFWALHRFDEAPCGFHLGRQRRRRRRVRAAHRRIVRAPRRLHAQGMFLGRRLTVVSVGCDVGAVVDCCAHLLLNNRRDQYG